MMETSDMKLKALLEMWGPGSLSLCGEDKPSYRPDFILSADKWFQCLLNFLQGSVILESETKNSAG